MLANHDYPKRINCDICGRIEEATINDLWLMGWTCLPQTQTGYKNCFRLNEQAHVCGGCLHVRRFGDKLNETVYSMKKEIMAEWAKMERE